MKFYNILKELDMLTFWAIILVAIAVIAAIVGMIILYIYAVLTLALFY